MASEVGLTVGEARAAPAAGARADAGGGAEAGAGAEECPGCGEALLGDYCHRCGEKRPESRDLSVRHFFGEAAQELSSVEHSKLFNTLRALLLRPGLLTNEWVAGRRKSYLKPLNLCLGLLALNLFAYSFYKPVSMYDLEKFVRHDGRPETTRMFDRFAARKGIGRDELFNRLGEKWQRYMALAPLVFVGAFALVLQLVLLFSRRYLVEHLVFSMHFVAFSTLVVLLLWPVYFVVGIKPGGVNLLIGVFKWVLDIVYMFVAVRAVYRLGTARTLVAAPLLVVGYFACYLLVLAGALGAAFVSVALS
jgi:hypothetical protein